jgi:hypothetical protein
MSLKEHVYSFDTIVIGSNLASLVYAYFNKLPIIISKTEIPPPIHFFDVDTDLSKFKIEIAYKDFLTPNGNILKGFNKGDLYTHLYYKLACNGQIIFDLPQQSIRLIKEQRLIKIVSERSRMFSFKYKKLISFTKDIIGLELDTRLDKYELIGYFNVTRSYLHHYTAITEQENGIINFGLFENFKNLITSTMIKKDILDKNHHIDFYLKSYLEKYLSTVLVQRGYHKIKVACNKLIKNEIYQEDVVSKDNVYLITYSEESIINGKDNQKFPII